MKYTNYKKLLGLFFVLIGSFSLVMRGMEPVELDLLGDQQPQDFNDLGESLLAPGDRDEDYKEEEAAAPLSYFGLDEEEQQAGSKWSECVPKFSKRCLQKLKNHIRRRWQRRTNEAENDQQEGYFELTEENLQVHQAELANVDQGLSKDQQKLMDKIRNGRGIVWDSVKVGNTDFADKNGNTPLMVAAERGRSDLVPTLLQSDYPSMNRQNAEGYTALMLAAMNGHDDVMEALFAYHTTIDLNIKNEDGLTALGLAIKEGQKNAIDFLLNKPKVTLDYKTFEVAVSVADVDTLKKLLGKWAEMGEEQKKAISHTKLLREADRIIVGTKGRLRKRNISDADRRKQEKLLKKQEKPAELLRKSGGIRMTPNEDTLIYAAFNTDPEYLEELLIERKSLSKPQKDAISRTKILKRVSARLDALEKEKKNLEAMKEILIRSGAKSSSRSQAEAGIAAGALPSTLPPGEVEIEVGGVVGSPITEAGAGVGLSDEAIKEIEAIEEFEDVPF